MKASEVRNLIGREIEWYNRHGWRYSGIVLEVAGKNVLVDNMGSNDWKWLPDMYSIKPIEINE
jgi:hypothetical protein